jgi:hypothetical protein
VIPGVSEWVRTLIALALVATLMDWLLPAGDLKRYATLVAGLIILVALIGPVWGLVQGIARGTAGGWLSPPRPGHLEGLVRRQERQEVEAVVDALPGVSDVLVTQSGSVVTVSVAGQGLSPGVAAAARAAVEEVMQLPAGRVRVVLEPRASGSAEEGGVQHESGLAHQS